MTNLLKILSLSGDGEEQTPTEEVLATALVWLDDTTLVHDGTFTTSWNNRGTGGSAYDFNVKYENPSNLEIATVNGMTVPYATGMTGIRTSSENTITSKATIFMVMVEETTSTLQRYFCDGYDSSGRLIIGQFATTGYAYAVLSGGAATLDTGVSLDQNLNLHTLQYNRADLSTYTVSGHGQATGVIGDVDFGIGSLFGQNISAGIYMVGKICEYLVFDSQLTYDEVLLIETYLKDKWIGSFEDIASTASIRFNETSIVGSFPVTEMTNIGTAGANFDLDDVVGTPAGLTTTTINDLDAVHADGTVGIRNTLDSQGVGPPITHFIMVKPDVGAGGFLIDYRTAGAQASAHEGWFNHFSAHGFDAGGTKDIVGIPTDASMRTWTVQIKNQSTDFFEVSNGLGVGPVIGPAYSKPTFNFGILFSSRTIGSFLAAAVPEWIILEEVLSASKIEIMQTGLSDKWIGSAQDLIAEALVHLDETGIVGSSPVTAWTNKGLGGSAGDLTVILGTASSLTRVNHHGLDMVDNGSLAAIKTASPYTITGPTTQFMVRRPTSTGGTQNWHDTQIGVGGQGTRRMYTTANTSTRIVDGAIAVTQNTSPVSNQMTLTIEEFHEGPTTSLEVVPGTITPQDTTSLDDEYHWGTLFGYRGGATNLARGAVGEYIAINRIMTDVEIDIIKTYLQNKWGIIE